MKKFTMLFTGIFLLFFSVPSLSEDTPPVGSPPPLPTTAENPVAKISANAGGYKWVKIKATRKYLGGARTWAQLRAPNENVWISCDDNECEHILVTAAESGHWVGLDLIGDNKYSFRSITLYMW